MLLYKMVVRERKVIIMLTPNSLSLNKKDKLKRKLK